jgi:membrane protein implicated in regulation of membrane protease activity
MPTPTSAHTQTASPATTIAMVTAELGQWLRFTLLGLLVSAAAVLAWRRLSGAVGSPPKPQLLLLAGAAAAAIAAVVRLRGAMEPRNPTVCRLFAWLPLPALAVLGAAVSFRTTPWAALLGFWSLLVLEECWAARGAVRGQRRRDTLSDDGDTLQRAVLDRSRVHAPHPVPPMPRLAVDDAADDAVTQRLTRALAADGSDVLGGVLRLHFAAGQRTASTHVAFCPPFPRTPGWNVQQREGPTARLKTTQLQPYGARIEVKIATPADEAFSVVLQFSARSAPEEGLEWTE